ncbi:hypothetical protein IWX90DRAFT_273517 [Phyllosticta citrichinensis]|uniref:MFS transporter n=1 Tax=Phyllosticta citrichinensis TaxID=1130410 RepID=A0ABR1XNE9_9PEZI
MYAFTASRSQIATYLFGIALFSISFLVFLNSTVSFVITERIGQEDNVGDAVGTLGFVDELVALVACPLWGIASDRIGVAKVAVMGYAIVALSLFVFVQATNVYPQLLLGRLLFSLGAAATTTMVTAVLPTMTYSPPPSIIESEAPRRETSGASHTVSPSISSDITITPDRLTTPSGARQYSTHHVRPVTPDSSAKSTSNLAGLVGMFTGLGALLALGIFLPLPARFQQSGVAPSEAIADSYYIVGSIATVVALACSFGLQKLPGEENKGWKNLFYISGEKFGNASDDSRPRLSYIHLLFEALALGFRDVNVGLGYLGGFVARASSVAVSLFIPLFANAYFISHGYCEPGDNKSTEEIKQACRRAYVLAAMITGTSQLVALISAPIFGYLCGQYKKYNQPIILASVAGIAGYIAFGLQKSPDPKSADGSYGVFFIAALLGISQIGAIVCSLGLLGRGIQGDEADINAAEEDERLQGHATHAGMHHSSRPHAIPRHVLDPEATPVMSPQVQPHNGNQSPSHRSSRSDMSDGNGSPYQLNANAESDPLLPSHFRRLPASSLPSSRAHLKGSIAGVYSLAGGAGILLLTKLGGVMFDELDKGAAFFLMAGFNAVLMIGALSVSLRRAYRDYKTRVTL